MGISISEEIQSSFGNYDDFDALYKLDQFNENLSVGIMHSRAALFGKNSSEVLDIDIYGVKGEYVLNGPDALVDLS